MGNQNIVIIFQITGAQSLRMSYGHNIKNHNFKYKLIVPTVREESPINSGNTQMNFELIYAVTLLLEPLYHTIINNVGSLYVFQNWKILHAVILIHKSNYLVYTDLPK